MRHSPISLKQLNSLIKSTVKKNLESYWLITEISEITINYSGHCYLEFVEKNEKTDKIEARSRAVIWSNVFRMIKPYFETTTGKSLSEGIKVMVRVIVEFHEVYGLSLNIVDIEPTYTVGEVALRKQKVLEKLENEGVLDMNKELELPYLLNRIAIISSKTAAGLEDFLDQLLNNSSGYKFTSKLFPAVMQGNEAESSIIGQLDRIFQLAHLFDAVIIIRGGGSQTDLDCFNNYWLAYNLAQFPLPIITGIGHEQDDSVVDVVANTRLKTPTAVAEFLIDHFSVVEEELLQTEEYIVSLSRELIAENKSRLKEKAYGLKEHLHYTILDETKKMSRLSSNYISSVKSCLFRNNQSVSKFQYSLNDKSNRFLSKGLYTMQLVRNQLQTTVKLRFANKKHYIDKAEQSIHLNNPVEILRKGYSITYHNGKSIKDSSQLKKGDELETQFYKGKKKSSVK